MEVDPEMTHVEAVGAGAIEQAAPLRDGAPAVIEPARARSLHCWNVSLAVLHAAQGLAIFAISLAKSPVVAAPVVSGDLAFDTTTQPRARPARARRPPGRTGRRALLLPQRGGPRPARLPGRCGRSVDPRALVDAGLEISVVGSFTRIGPAVRSRLFGWSPPPAGAMAGRTALVTGPTSGLGRAATDALAGLGARVVLVGRSEERLTRLRDELARVHGEDRFPVVVADMGSLASVRAAVARVLATESRLDVLVDNAGAIYPERIEGPDGIEATFAILVVSPFALAAGLQPLLRRTPGSQVIAVTSGGMYTQRLDLDDLQSRTGPYTGALAYARAKRAQVALVREWARRCARSGVSYAVMHPGWADTPGLAETLPGFYRLMRPLLRTAADGVDTIVWLATHPAPASTSGRLYLDRRPRPFDRVPATRLSAADRRRLWAEVVELAGEDPVSAG
jgi:NAD(P)-dependent dehydrogenase (short-subunit alcohol dehydrogenase family)